MWNNRLNLKCIGDEYADDLYSQYIEGDDVVRNKLNNLWASPKTLAHWNKCREHFASKGILLNRRQSITISQYACSRLKQMVSTYWANYS